MITSGILNTRLLIVLGLILFYGASCGSSDKQYKDWKSYGGSSENIKYSALAEIDTTNVGKLHSMDLLFRPGVINKHHGYEVKCPYS